MLRKVVSEMSTRGNICIEKEDGSVDGVYCHTDSYPAYLGLVLYAFYNKEEMVKKLINLGSLSSIGPRIGQKVDFDKIPYLYGTEEYEKIKCQCIAYHRDRNEEKEIYHWKNWESCYKTIGFDINYIYIFRKGAWYVKSGNSKRLVLLKNVLKEDWVKKGRKNQNLCFYINDVQLSRSEKILLYKAYEELDVLNIYLNQFEKERK